jgi:hypothetical protein
MLNHLGFSADVRWQLEEIYQEKSISEHYMCEGDLCLD